MWKTEGVGKSSSFSALSQAPGCVHAHVTHHSQPCALTFPRSQSSAKRHPHKEVVPLGLKSITTLLCCQWGGVSHFGRQCVSFLQNFTHTHHMIQQSGSLVLKTKRGETVSPHKNRLMNVHTSFTHNCQNLEATTMSFNG